MTYPYRQVKEFHQLVGQPVGQKPQLLDEVRSEFRESLIREEVRELTESLNEGDLVNIAKEAADVVYVVAGLCVEMGIDLDEVFNVVHASNLSKLDENGKPIFNEHGKVLKGPNYSPPDVATTLGI